MNRDPFTADISRHVWNTKYRWRDGDVVHDRTIEDTWRRIARALAAVEKDQGGWESRFYDILGGFKFLPGGRIQAGAGTGRRVTLFNCFVMGAVQDSMDGIFDGLKEGALTMQQGGGVGYDFSTLRPKGMPAKSVGTIASGPVSFMRIWDAMCATLLSTGARRGAMMATLRCDHPDIEEFIAAKREHGALRHFNLSVLVSDAFMQAVRQDQDWALVFPADDSMDGGGTTPWMAEVEQRKERLPRTASGTPVGDVAGGGEIVECTWSGRQGPVPCRVLRRVRARELWERILRATYEYAEPGVLFIDRINKFNNLWYREHISATNPCVTADTWIHTTEGPRQVHDLVGRQFRAIVNGQVYDSTPSGFFSTGPKPVYMLKTKEGYGLRLTADHPVLRVTELTRWALRSEWTKSGDLKPGDRVLVHNHRTATEWTGPYGESEGYLLGLLIGDGTFSETTAEVRVWPDMAVMNEETGASGVDAVMQAAKTIAMDMPHRSDFTGWRQAQAGYRYMRLTHLTRIAKDLGVVPGNKTVTPAVERCSSGFYRGFLRGLFDTDGSVQGSQAKGVSVRLAQSDDALLKAVQRMLLRLGIASTLYCERRAAGPRLLPDGRGGRRMYECRADHELVVSGDNLPIFAESIGFTDTQKQARLVTALNNYKRSHNRERFVATVESIVPDGTTEVFDVQIPGINTFDANGLCVHNCGEIPLPPYGACDLGSINLTAFVREPFSDKARLDTDALRATVATAVRLMDNVIDASQFPLPAQAEQARGSRRVGLGLTGLADTLILLGLRYDEEPARTFAAETMQAICHAAYAASIELAREKGPFPFFERDKFLSGEFIRHLPTNLQEDIAHHGIRNSHLTAIAPTGTISLLANNISSGLEPVYDFCFRRRMLELDGSYAGYELVDEAFRRWRAHHPDGPLPRTFVSTHQLAPADHLAMQAALQPHVDNSISKTINVPQDLPFAAFQDIYDRAYDLGLKGCTTFRPNPVTGAVLSTDEPEDAAHCCTIEREAD